MPKIEEMSLEDLRTFAINLESENGDLRARNSEQTQRIEELTGLNTELTGLNKELQKRNNKLLLQVEQDTPEPVKEEPAKPVESCEDFARKLILNK